MTTTQIATPWAVLLCKFNDNSAEPFSKIYYQNLFTNAGVGLFNIVDFFRVYSHGVIDIGGSQVFGWFTLPESIAQARAKGRVSVIPDAKAVASAQGIDLASFWGIMVFTNVPFETFGILNGRAAVADSLGTAPRILAQEVGHGYGLDHSMADGVAGEYQDPWDVMSALSAAWTPNPSFGQIGPGLNAANMDARGWLDPERIWQRTGWFDELVQLRPHHRRDLDGYLVARVGIYYVEFRVKEDWDAGISSPVVLVHRLEGNRSWLMAGAGGQRFLPQGAVFEHIDSSIKSRVEVLSIDAVARQAVIRLSYRLMTLKTTVVPYPVPLGRRIVVTVSATDGLTGTPVAGQVHLYTFTSSGRQAIPPFATDTPTAVTLRAKRVFDPVTKTWTETEPPGGTVIAPGYANADLDLGS